MLVTTQNGHTEYEVLQYVWLLMNGLLELCLQRLAWCGPLENLSPAMLESLVSQHPDQCWGQPLSAEQLLYWPTSMQQWSLPCECHEWSTLPFLREATVDVVRSDYKVEQT